MTSPVEREPQAQVEVAWDVPDACLADERVRAAVKAALELGQRSGLSLAVVFVDDASLAAMHAEHLDDPSLTDVMAFDLGEEGPGPAGELYVSVDRAREVAERRGVTFERELLLYVVHGTLHLCGFDDHAPEERARMRAAEARALTALGFEADEAPHDTD